MLTADFIKDIIDHITIHAIEDARDAARKVREDDPRNEYGAGCAYDRTMKYWEENCLNTLWDEYNRLTEEYGEDAE